MRVPTSSYVVCWVFQLLKDALLVFMSLTEVTGCKWKAMEWSETTNITTVW